MTASLVGAMVLARSAAALLTSIGLAVLAGGMALLAVMPDAPADWDVAWRIGVSGVGFGFYQTPNKLGLMTAGPPRRSGMVAVARTLGWSLGAALVAVIFDASGSQGATTCLQVCRSVQASPPSAP